MAAAAAKRNEPKAAGRPTRVRQFPNPPSRFIFNAAKLVSRLIQREAKDLRKITHGLGPHNRYFAFMKHWELPVSGRAFAQLSHPKDDVDNSEKTLEDLGVNGLKNRFGLN